MREKFRCENCPSRALSLFGDLPKDRMRELNSHKAVNVYKEGQALFYEGNHPQGISCIASGKIKVYKGGSAGRQYILRIVGKGALVGYRNFFANEPYGIGAEAIEDSSLCFFNRTAVMSLLSRNPDLSLRLIERFCQELSSLDQRAIDLIDKPARVRLARFLLDLKETHGKAAGADIELDLYLTREEIAECVGITRETTVRLLTEFERLGILKAGSPRILVKNLPLLLETARLPL